MHKPFELLVNSTEFCKRLQDDVAQAKQRLWVQTLSYEADVGGYFLENLLKNNSIPNRRMILDKFYRIIMDDSFIYSPSNWRNKALWDEVRNTQRSLQLLQQHKVKIKEVNPLGLLARKLCKRDHKKIICVDDFAAYIGGINFSAHNFEWHDFMLRITDPQSISILQQDFSNTWQDNSKSAMHPIEQGYWLSLNGQHNPRQFAPIIKLIDNAKSHIRVHSPYLSSPFVDHLTQAAKRGVRVDFITAAQNNWQLFSGYLRYATCHPNFHIHAYQPGFSHLKAMQIDEQHLILGSCNFDYYSYHNHSEIMLVSQDQMLLKDFDEKIWQVDLAQCRSDDASAAQHQSWQDYLCYLSVRAIMTVTAAIAK